MVSIHPGLPTCRPLAISHRGGNSLEAAREALGHGADILEADVWPRLGKLEIRHVKSIGPLPIYWEKWYIDSIGGRHVRLAELVAALPSEARLFYDLKGWHLRLGSRVVEAVTDAAGDRPIMLCGRNWRQLEPVRHLPNVHIFYSVGEKEELARVWPMLAGQDHPAISIHYRLLTGDVIARLQDLGATIIAWTVNDPAIAHTLFDQGVDGFTSDNRQLLADIARYREHAFDDDPAAALPAVPKGLDDE